MKHFKIYNLFILFALTVATVSCVKDDEFDTPDTTIIDPELGGEIVSLSSIRSSYQQAVAAGESTFTYEATNTFAEGFVISSDEGGNFFEEIILQDSAENPQAGVKVLIDVNPLFTKYEMGRKVFIKLDGLTVGLDSGVLTLGVLSEGQIEKIPSPNEADFLIRSSETATIIPTVKTLSQITEDDVNTLIQLPNAQFTESQIDLSFANEPGDEFDGDRIIESCSDDGGTILFQTSTFADFKGLNLPDGSGSITAVLTRDFFGEQFVLNVNEPGDINFDSPDRCEPMPLDPGLQATTTFAAVRARFQQAGGYEEFGTDEDPLIIEGYVISSDEKGNFFDEIFIQNTPGTEDLGPNNPRLGLRVIMDKNDIYQTFPVGRKVYVKLNGLAINEDSGILTIGLQNVAQIEKIPDGSLDLFVVGGQEIEELQPLNVSVNELNADDLNTLVQLDDMQFTIQQLGLTYAGEPGDNFDGERNLESCDETGDIRLFTSTFADFKSQILDPDSGQITAVYSNDFSGDERILTIRDLDDVNFTGERCDPPVVDCGIAGTTGTNILFTDFFESQTTGTPITGNGWTNYIEAGTETWEAFFDDGTNASLGISARMGSFNSGDASSIGWLITPEIDFNAQDGETLNFKTSNSFSDGSEMQVLFSSDWDGNPANITSATWSSLSSANIVDDSAFFGDWIPSGNVDLSCIDGAGYIAFKYIGSGDEAFDGTYELDEIVVNSN
ncbi:DUF5689 domain-containing protein [Marinirhabdus gelatinilytica]|uniref:DUF5689 domain-containing protein n=1 Tax=Marinirhabdus gelatinilytica TaxID=1703343 RepID=A0A370QK57_9FLAO|nr:DUF5689 domain-containing protein [Marinirhabdus gelatinilytica]RDK88716.1 hypothetical protein C8D94_101592 [Marinirhabdus gelatinilytica]